MRMRNKKHRDERLAACGHLLLETPSAPIVSSADVFCGDAAPLWLEIGCGKGDFAVGMAEKHPEARLVAFERVSNVMVVAVEKANATAESRPDNLRFAVADAANLSVWFADGSLDAIYLNFSDPWPKKGYAKRRLTHRGFLQTYFRLLKKGGRLCFKTDNVGLFDFTLEELEALGKTPEFVTRDLHNSEANEGNVMTEYERNFSEKGFPIHALTLTL